MSGRNFLSSKTASITSVLFILLYFSYSALLKLLHESVGSGSSSKFTELVMKCNWKVIRILEKRNNDLDLDQILLDVHNFLVVRLQPV